MNISRCKNIILNLLLISQIFSNELFPEANAGDDIDKNVTECDNQNIIISISGESSSNPASGVCDTGSCSNDSKYCTTYEGSTGDSCNTIDDCSDVMVCLGGENENVPCSDNPEICTGIDSVCGFPGACLSLYAYKSHCEAAGEIWTADYKLIDEDSCEEKYGESNNYWHDLSKEFEWSTDDIRVTIVDSEKANTNIIIDPLESSNSEEYKIYLTVNNQFESDMDELSIVLNPVLPCAVGGDDIHMCRACAIEGSKLYNEEYKTLLEDSILQLDGTNSYTSTSNNISFNWNAPDGFSLSNENFESPKIIIDYPNARNAVNIFTLEVEVASTSENLISILDTVILYMDPSRPIAPKVEVYTENDVVTLNWERNSSMNSIDSLTGYADFEGYRIYRSLDGGETWGGADDMIFYNGIHVGWRHKEQFDLSKNQDSTFCIKGVDSSIVGENDESYKTWDDCVEKEVNAKSCCEEELIRGSEISHLDPYAPWVDLGDDEGLKFSYVDTNVYNGKEYTYAVVAYDVGLMTYSELAIPKKVCDDPEGGDMDGRECGFGGCIWSQLSTEEGICIYEIDVGYDWQGQDNNSIFEDQCSGLINQDDCNSYQVNDFCGKNLTEEGAGADDPDIYTAISCVNYGLCTGCDGLTETIESDCCGDGDWEPYYREIQTWHNTNPEEFTYHGISGYRSLESNFIDSINVVTAIPAFYAENIDNIASFIDKTVFGIPAEDKFMFRSNNTIGNGGVYFQFVNPYDLTDKMYQFEISADHFIDYNVSPQTGDTTYNKNTIVFEGYKVEDPKLYVWEINKDSSVIYQDYSKIDEDDLDDSEICELMNLPGAYRDGSCSKYTMICEGGGTKEGTDCTYEIDCGDGTCVQSEINYLDNYYSCLCDQYLYDFNTEAVSPNDNGLVSQYNFWEYEEGDDENTIYYPVYEIEDFPVKYLFQDGYDENYTPFIDGVKVLFSNNVKNISDLYYEIVHVNELKSYDKNDQLTDLSDDITVYLKYGSQNSAFTNKPSYSYRIEFSDSPKHEATKTVSEAGCDKHPNTTSFLPFEVINTTTEKTVGIYHVDKGTNQDLKNLPGIECSSACNPSEYCDPFLLQCTELKGIEDCFWGRNERSSMKLDTIHVGLTSEEKPQYTFDLKIDYWPGALQRKGVQISRVSNWGPTITYEENDIVKYNEMYWEANSSPILAVPPTDWVDDGNGNNINAWLPIYPWNDGDYITIEPTRWYVDGDRWIANLSELAKDSEITEKTLEEVSVVPNPYIIYSDYDETVTSRRLWFNHLPNRCRITIYTISGERVISILHDDDNLSGKESWDLRSKGGDMVAPGLYIYTVESEDYSNNYIKYISKFAIIR